MKDDYLWDKSGEPDPQIQQLEEILGTLRYQPTPLELPDELPLRPRRNYVPLLAIAATIVIALLAGGLWLRVQTEEATIPSVAIAQPPAPISSGPMAQPPAPIIDQPLSLSPRPLNTRKPVLARHNRDREEALAAKRQLMFALRLASEKLNAAYRRTQDKRSSYEDTLPN